MRVKRTVDFRMAPKKSSKCKGVSAEPTRAEGWTPSKCSKSDLESLVKLGFFISKISTPLASCLGWRSSVWKYGRNRCFCPLFWTGIRAPMLQFLFWAPVLLWDPASPSHLFIFLFSYTCVKHFWASSLILIFSANSASNFSFSDMCCCTIVSESDFCFSLCGLNN